MQRHSAAQALLLAMQHATREAVKSLDAAGLHAAWRGLQPSASSRTEATAQLTGFGSPTHLCGSVTSKGATAAEETLARERAKLLQFLFARQVRPADEPRPCRFCLQCALLRECAGSYVMCM